MDAPLWEVLARNRRAVLTAWVRLAHGPGGPPLPDGEPAMGPLLEGFDGLLAALREGDRQANARFAEAIAARGVDRGVAVSQAIRALLTLKPACLSVLREEGWESASILTASEQLDDVVGWTVATLGERYSARVEEVLASQVERLRENEEELLARTTQLDAQRGELERRVREIAALNQSAMVLNSSLEPDTVLQSIVERAAELMGTGLCAIYEWDAEAGRLRGRLAMGLRREIVLRIAEGVSVEPGAVGQVIQGHRPLAVGDMERAAGRLPEPALLASREQGIRAALAAPLVAHGQLFGYLATYFDAPREFSEHEIALLSAFAEHAAAALENARLYAQAKRLAAAEERNRIAREIHDTIAQGLSGLVLELQGIGRILERDPTLAREELTEAVRLARHTLQEARRSVWELRARSLEAMTLAEAIQEEAAKLLEVGVEARFGLEGEARDLGPEAEHNLYRIAQEALANVRRHSRARHAVVTLRFLREQVELLVEDDGVGFSQESESGAESGHFGLLGMRDRSRLLGGSFDVESAPGVGTRLRARVPLSPSGERSGSDAD